MTITGQAGRLQIQEPIGVLRSVKDALLELGFVNSGGVFVYKWDQSTYQWSNVSGGLPSSGNYLTMNLYDMDGDGIRDVVATRPGAVEVYIGNGSNNWQPR